MTKHSPNQSLADALERIERAEAIVTRYVIRHGYDIVDMAIVARNMETIVAAAKAAIQNELALSKIEPTS